MIEEERHMFGQRSREKTPAGWALVALAAVVVGGCQVVSSIERDEIEDELFQFPAGRGGGGAGGEA
ncbi:MAG TPA: hypothetical protein VFS00_28615, partial [Polyangiaceae bacterium]|nr:hypothetical protein [Polyangiaceae bacterium]